MKDEAKYKVAIVGCPNVGKSVVFGALSGRYAVVSNYPGTTVEVTRAVVDLNGHKIELVDTPGMYSLTPVSDEERVGRRILIDENPDLVIHVVDAKNLGRMLPMTFQLEEAGIPLILVLNIMDEAGRHGVDIDVERLSEELGIPVVPAVAVSGKGIELLKQEMHECLHGTIEVKRAGRPYPPEIDSALRELDPISTKVSPSTTYARRGLASLLLKGDEELLGMIKANDPAAGAKAKDIVDAARIRSAEPVEYLLAVRDRELAEDIISRTVSYRKVKPGFVEGLSRMMMRPLTGVPILLCVLYFGLYKFVGSFGAGVVVDFLDDSVFGSHVNPFITMMSEKYIPWAAVRDLVAGEYGLLTMAVRYAIALILPLVTFFFLVFAVIEDTGYLPRLAMLVDRVFKRMGMSGRAVIPMVLGLGCDTMATIVTRTLPTARERLIATLLLALAVPCSAQLGVILALIEGHTAAMVIWSSVLFTVFLAAGYLSGQLVPGERATFYMELPPLRWPKLSNVLIKTYSRVVWYFREVLPLFLLASLLIWMGKLIGLFDYLVGLLVHPVRMIGLPDKAAEIFLFGFFRRDYGAAGLYEMHKSGMLDGTQLVVSCVGLTLFLPCIAQFMVNIKERGWRSGLAISGVVLVLSFGVSYIVNLLIRLSGVSL